MQCSANGFRYFRSDPNYNVITLESIPAASLMRSRDAVSLSREPTTYCETHTPAAPSKAASNEAQKSRSSRHFLAVYPPEYPVYPAYPAYPAYPGGKKTLKRLERKLQSQQKASEKNGLVIKQLSTVIAINPYRYPVGSRGNTRAWKDAVEKLVRENILKDGDRVRQYLQKKVCKCVTNYKKSFVIPEPGTRPERELTVIETLAGEIYQLQINGAQAGKVFRKKLRIQDDDLYGLPMDVSANAYRGVGPEDHEVSEKEVANENAEPVDCLPDGIPGKSDLAHFDHAFAVPMISSNTDVVSLEANPVIFSKPSQDAVILSQEPTVLSETPPPADPSNVHSYETKKSSSSHPFSALGSPETLVPLAPVSKKAQKRFDACFQVQKKAAEKNTLLIKQLSTVITVNPYRYPVGSFRNTNAWKDVVARLVQEKILMDGRRVRERLQKNVGRCVREYKRLFVLADPEARPKRKLTETEMLAEEIYQLQVNGAPGSKLFRRNLKDDNSCNGIAVDVSAGSYHDVGSGDREENGEEVTKEDDVSKLLRVHCFPNKKSGQSNLPRPCSGATQSPLPRAGTPTTPEIQSFLLCSGPSTPLPPTVSPNQQAVSDSPCGKASRPKKLRAAEKCALCSYRSSVGIGKSRSVFRFPEDELRQKKWMKVCIQVDQNFRLCRESFVCEEHFVPECFGSPRVRNGVESMRLRWFAVPSLTREEKGHWPNWEAASESDEEMEGEEDRRAYENGLPTAVDLSAGLPSTRISENRTVSENGKENLSEYFCCPTCGICEEPCWVHAKFIKDKNVYPLAYSSLPTQLEFKPDENKGSPAGVISRIPLRSHTVFGPMRGALCSHTSSRFGIVNSSGWKYYHLDSDDVCNWMTYVKSAKNAQEQNLAAYIKEEQIFFITTRDIKSDEELKVWYSRKYVDLLGIFPKDNFEIIENVDDGISVDGDGVIQSYGDDVRSLGSHSIESPSTDLEENAVQDALDSPKELTDDSVENLLFSPRLKRSESASPMEEMMGNKNDLQMSHNFDNLFPFENHSESVPGFPSVLNESENSDQILRDGHATSDQLSSSNRKPGSAERRERQNSASAVIFSCLDCRINFPSEQFLILHNYQHSGDLSGVDGVCPGCEVIFENLGDLSQHVSEHGKKYFPVENCAYCDAVISVRAMNEHFRHRHPEMFVPSTKAYPCSRCGAEFDGNDAYRQHMSASHGRRMDCLFCGKIETSSISMSHHTLMHKADDGFHCPKCPKVFRSYAKVRQHYARHNKKEPKPRKKRKPNSKGRVSKFFTDPSTKVKFPCAICRKYYKTEALLEVHRQFHKTELDKSYKGDDVDKKCPECGEECDTADGLFRHVEGHGVTFYARERCPVCNKFIAAHLLERHIDGNHPSEETENGEKYPCEVCRKAFPSKLKLIAHIQMHKPKKCLLCAEIFDGYRMLGRHALTHKQADGFHCQNCDAVFATFRRLTNHHRNRHDIRRIVTCELCGKMCGNRSALHRHTEVEHGSKEFSHECEVCGKKFMQRNTLRNHVVSAHSAMGRKKVHDSQVEFMKKGYVAPRKRMLLGEFPFKCGTCQVGFLVEGRLLRHMTKFHPEVV